MMEKATSISFIIPFVYHNSTLEGLLKEISKITINHECILIHDSASKISPIDVKKYDILIENGCNMGPAFSRNVGLMQAKMDYVMFIDSDDVIYSGAFKRLRLETDIAVFNYIVRHNNSSFYSKLKGCGYDLIIENGSLWNKIIRRSFLTSNKITFKNEYSICEDTIFFIRNNTQESIHRGFFENCI